MTQRGIHALWITIRRGLLLLAEGSAGGMTGDRISHSKSSTVPPPQAADELQRLEREWEGAQTDADRVAVVKGAHALLEQHTLPNPDPRVLRGTREWREAIAHDPRSSRDVARMFGIGKTTVLRCREEFKDFRVR